MTKIEKCANTQKNRIVIHHEFNEEKRIFKNELDQYKADGWAEGISDAHRQVLSEKHKGKTTWNKGIPMTEETKNKISESLKNADLTPWNKNKDMTDERVAAAVLKANETKLTKYGKVFVNDHHMDEKHRKNISNGRKGKPSHWTDESLRIKLSHDY